MFVFLAFVSAVIVTDRPNTAMETFLNFTPTSLCFILKKKYRRTNEEIHAFKNIHIYVSDFNKGFFVCAVYAMELIILSRLWRR